MTNLHSILLYNYTAQPLIIRKNCDCLNRNWEYHDEILILCLTLDSLNLKSSSVLRSLLFLFLFVFSILCTSCNVIKVNNMFMILVIPSISVIIIRIRIRINVMLSHAFIFYVNWINSKKLFILRNIDKLTTSW